MDVIIKYQQDKDKFCKFVQKPLSFYTIINLADENDISRGAALNSTADMALNVAGLEDYVKFLRFAARNALHSTSQLLQDLFASYCIDDEYPTFLEFGATDGVSLSNSYHLETKLGWTGVLAEPSPQWHMELHNNRPDTVVITECIWSETGKTIEFFVSDHGVLSTIAAYTKSDQSSMPGNTAARNSRGYFTKVNSVSLNDVICAHFAANGPSYMSVDTEGSEFDILKACDFERYRPKVLTVEHNFTEQNKKLDELFSRLGYVRVFQKFTDFDAWYVEQAVHDRVFSQ